MDQMLAVQIRVTKGYYTKKYMVNVTIPNANMTTAANIRLFFYRAMAAALQAPGSLPRLFEPGLDGSQELVTSAAAASAAL